MQRIGAALVVLASLLAGGCLVEINHTDDPGPVFAQARAEADRLQGKSGHPHRVNVLVFDKGERKLVHACVPLWLARKLAKDGEVDLGDMDEHVGRRIRLRDLEEAGLGVLVEVEEDEGDRVLVWLS
jgi:hypothetical protein